MKTWTDTSAAGALATLFILAGCAGDNPGSIVEAGPEAFDTDTIYEIVSPTFRGAHSVLLRFDDAEAKRGFTEAMDARFSLEPMTVSRAARVRDCGWALDAEARTRVCIWVP